MEMKNIYEKQSVSNLLIQFVEKRGKSFEMKGSFNKIQVLNFGVDFGTRIFYQVKNKRKLKMFSNQLAQVDFYLNFKTKLIGAGCTRLPDRPRKASHL